MGIYSDEERRVALTELSICLTIIDGIVGDWRDPGGCAQEIAHTLRDRYDLLNSLVNRSGPPPRSC
ncbi:MAG TPA: hypothetical protein VJ692_06265 [Nitrospiraceae bacterium]|nr:hypothetical protein [Nitrospiraceae bacterium]